MASSVQPSLDQAPPFSIPLLFFLTAPLFGVIAGLLIFFFGPDALVSRWSEKTLAITHLLTIGVLGMLMCGALTQILPVVAGSPIPGVRWVGPIVHLLLTLGTLLLAGGFLSGYPAVFIGAVASLGVGFGLFILVATMALYKSWKASSSVVAIRLAIIGLLVTIVIGIYLALQFSGIVNVRNLMLLTNIHLAWGFLGWIGLLIAGMAFQVLPMFQMTPEYPGWFSRSFPIVIFIVLSSWSLLALFWMPSEEAYQLVWLIACIYGLFVPFSLYLQHHRRRKVSDISLFFWGVGLAVLFLVCLLYLIRHLGLWSSSLPSFALLQGGLLIYGFAISLTNGMLYKIVPFLAWFHLQNRKMKVIGVGGVRVPNMKELLSEPLVQSQFGFHLAALLVLGLALYRPEWFSRPFGLLAALSSALLWFNLYRVVYRYRRVNSGITNFAKEHAR
ncbi:MAG: hypothetical protein QF586_05825 [Arenicellales bacterium]|nr:hypothetical protein [Arenicellales bacterium]MDP7155583.1 hypothetical protein [Arenicellales bacterium]MDP7283233.1 hypothetical protein [Arenicellales bacterium]MEE1540032.1 hypothetical protein [Arenicellales bacterium]HJL65790.1 hypothetical protein [Arenicellales bacterium]